MTRRRRNQPAWFSCRRIYSIRSALLSGKLRQPAETSGTQSLSCRRAAHSCRSRAAAGRTPPRRRTPRQLRAARPTAAPLSSARRSACSVIEREHCGARSAGARPVHMCAAGCRPWSTRSVCQRCRRAEAVAPLCRAQAFSSAASSSRPNWREPVSRVTWSLCHTRTGQRCAAEDLEQLRAVRRQRAQLISTHSQASIAASVETPVARRALLAVQPGHQPQRRRHRAPAGPPLVRQGIMTRRPARSASRSVASQWFSTTTPAV
jgi:hypothetical protein